MLTFQGKPVCEKCIRACRECQLTTVGDRRWTHGAAHWEGSCDCPPVVCEGCGQSEGTYQIEGAPWMYGIVHLYGCPTESSARDEVREAVDNIRSSDQPEDSPDMMEAWWTDEEHEEFMRRGSRAGK